MVDTGATSSYVCTDLITKLGIKPVRGKTVEEYNITIKSSVIEGFQLKVGCVNTEKDVLTNLQNPKITRTKNQNPRIKGLRLQEVRFTFHYIILGVADYQRI